MASGAAGKAPEPARRSIERAVWMVSVGRALFGHCASARRAHVATAIEGKKQLTLALHFPRLVTLAVGLAGAEGARRGRSARRNASTMLFAYAVSSG